jgi:TP901 family phage tail tape measure protein
MAFDVSYTIEAIDKFSATGRRIEKAVGRVDKKVERFSSRATKRFSKIAAGFAGIFGGLGVALAGGKAFRIATTFEESLLGLSAITGATGKDLEALKLASFDLGKQFSTTGASVLQGMDLIASQRPELLKNIPALIGVTKEALKLKNAAGLAFPEVAKIVGKTMNQFSLANERAIDVVNVLAASSQAGTARITDIGAALLNSAQSAAEAGFTFEDTVSILQLMAKTSKGGAEDGVKLRNVISILTDAGVDFNKLGPQNALIKVRDALGQIQDPLERAKIANKLFGRETKEGALSILNSVDSIGKFTTAITGTNKAQELADIRLSGFMSKMRRLGVILEEKIVPTFDRLLPTLEKITTRFGKFIESFSPEDIQRFAESISVLADGLSRLVGILSGPGGSILKAGITQVAATAGLVDPTAQFKREVAAFGRPTDKEPVKVEIKLAGATEFVESVTTGNLGSVTGLRTGKNMTSAIR